jgi:glycogen debranching enzyme
MAPVYEKQVLGLSQAELTMLCQASTWPWVAILWIRGAIALGLMQASSVLCNQRRFQMVNGEYLLTGYHQSVHPNAGACLASAW